MAYLNSQWYISILMAYLVVLIGSQEFFVQAEMVSERNGGGGNGTHATNTEIIILWR